MTVRESTLTPLPILACAPGDVVVFDARPSTIVSMRDHGTGFVTFTYQPQFCIPRSTTLSTDTDLLVVTR